MLRALVKSVGYRAVGVSLWRPERTAHWLQPESDGPPLEALPDNLWILGLGHLGQAFLWTLLMCPYADRSAVRLVLQDIDTITGSTDSTSILTQDGMLGAMKTRAVAGVLERHGFKTTLIERPFDGGFRCRAADDPQVLICGVDNLLARSQVEGPGFPFVVEAEIGDSSQDFRSIRLHTFPASRRAAHLWIPGMEHRVMDLDSPGYRRLSEAGTDICGLTRLAETAVSASASNIRRTV